MIIDQYGKVIPGQAWWYENGPLITHFNKKYNMEFSIGVYYNEEQKGKYAQIAELKKSLRDTDYKALKYADGAYTEEQYKPVKEARARWRAEINKIEEDFIKPTLTDEEIDYAEETAMEYLKADLEERTGKTVEEIRGANGQ